jgi:hypothetical protein
VIIQCLSVASKSSVGLGYIDAGLQVVVSTLRKVAAGQPRTTTVVRRRVLRTGWNLGGHLHPAVIEDYGHLNK